MVSCAHCIGEYREEVIFERRFRGQSRKTNAWLVGASTTGDYAIYRAKSHRFSADEGLLLSSNVERDAPPGTHVYVMGVPMGFDMNSVSDAVVRETNAALPTSIFGYVDAPPHITIAGPVYGGNSGGPIIARVKRGTVMVPIVVGIVSTGWSGSEYESNYNAGVQADIIRRSALQIVQDFDINVYLPIHIKEAYIPARKVNAGATSVGTRIDGIEGEMITSGGPDLQAADLVTKVDWYPTGAVRPNRPSQGYTNRRNIGDSVSIEYIRPDLGGFSVGANYYSSDFSLYPAGSTINEYYPASAATCAWDAGRISGVASGEAWIYPSDLYPLGEWPTVFLGDFSIKFAPYTGNNAGTYFRIPFYGHLTTDTDNAYAQMSFSEPDENGVITTTLSVSGRSDTQSLTFVEEDMGSDLQLDFAYQRQKISETVSKFVCSLSTSDGASSVTLETPAVEYGFCLINPLYISSNLTVEFIDYSLGFMSGEADYSTAPQTVTVQLVAGEAGQADGYLANAAARRFTNAQRKRLKNLKDLGTKLRT